MRQGDLAQVQAWLDDGLKVDALFWTRWGALPPLDFAIMAGNLGAVKLLLAEGADPEQMAQTTRCDETGAKKAAAEAFSSNPMLNSEEVDLIRKEDTRVFDTYSPLMFAAANGSLDIASLGSPLIGGHARVAPHFFSAPAGATARWLATLAGHKNVVALLVEAKADRSTLASCAQIPAGASRALTRRWSRPVTPAGALS